MPNSNDERVTRILKRVRRIELITRGLVRETLGGAYHSRFKGQGIEFDDFREYQPGDDVRFIDWNVTARMNDCFVRKYVEEREMTVLLLVDVSSSGDYGSGDDSKRERAAELAAVFAFSAVQNQDKVGLAMFSDEVEFYLPARKGSAQALRIVREILNYSPRHRRTAIEPALDLAVNRIAHRSLVFVISDFITPRVNDGSPHASIRTGNAFPWERSLRAAAAKHDVVAVRVTDPREMVLPNVGKVSLEDPETRQQAVVDTSDPSVRQAYHERLIQFQDDLTLTFRRNNVEQISIQTDSDYLPALKTYFRSRKRR
jgi:uncharacterized protein (DUF58 family)